MAIAQTTGWLCGQCGNDAGEQTTCPHCDAVLLAAELPVLRRRIAPAVPFLAVLTLMGVLVAVILLNGDETPVTTGSLASEISETPVPPSSPSPSSMSPTPPDLSVEQATAIDDLLTNSQASRLDLGAAIAGVTRCQSSAIDVISDITEARRAQLESALDLRVDFLSEGTALKGHLVSALDSSYKADAAYQAAAEEFLAAGCSGSPAFGAGNWNSERATTHKTRFVAIWNPIASGFGLPTRKVGEI
ncbi:hypothetical protein GCM10009555_087080 [Acrocarpospora macrocephala]|uniref:Uncharacterized protein n=1 Tax=Acrocarpospora macrocephala TaxID=150177 RepID=A0A5M3WRP6_9ACTN|nr:hypothetical protein [Acrocarpospora macrocephala]GES08858.1 hypothetical protein Amac_024540 [Acrocarpospora macrocephala]